MATPMRELVFYILLHIIHSLTLLSSLSVPAVAFYIIIKEEGSNSSLRYWIALGILSVFFYAQFLARYRSSRWGYFKAALALSFVVMWIAALALAVRQYGPRSRCGLGYFYEAHCRAKRAIISLILLNFLLASLGAAIELLVLVRRRRAQSYGGIEKPAAGAAAPDTAALGTNTNGTASNGTAADGTTTGTASNSTAADGTATGTAFNGTATNGTITDNTPTFGTTRTTTTV